MLRMEESRRSNRLMVPIREWAQQNPNAFPLVVLILVFCACVAAIWAVTRESDKS